MKSIFKDGVILSSKYDSIQWDLPRYIDTIRNTKGWFDA